MQLYVADYLADTMELSTVEHGAYLLLLMTMWRHGAKLPNDPTKLARIARLSPAKFKPVWAEISRFFVVEGDSITNRRLRKEHQKAKEKSEVRATAGKAGGEAKALKDKEARLANASDLPWHSSDIRSQIEESSSSSSAGVPADAEKPISEGLIPRLTHALGFDHHGHIPKYWITPEAGMIVGRWRADLGLTDDEIVAVALGSAKAHNGPANGPKILNEAMSRYAAEKAAPPLRPSENPNPAPSGRPSGHGIKAQLPEKYRQ